MIHVGKKEINAPAGDWRGQPALATRPRGTGPFYFVAFLATLLSLDTAVRFFGEELGIAGLKVNGFSVELAAVCGIGELTLIACGYAMRHNVRRPDGTPGVAQLVALAMCGAAGFMAYAVSGPVGGTVRTFFGPVTALVTLHLALRIEIKVRRGISAGAWARVGRELRERALSRLGLADDERDALARTRDRATDRAARLAADPGRVPFRRHRLARAVRVSGVALDEAAKDRMLRQVAALKNIGSLREMRTESPWHLHAGPRVSLVKTRPAVPAVTAAEVRAEIAAAVAPILRTLAARQRREPAAGEPQKPAGLPAETQAQKPETAVVGLEAKRQQVAEAVTFVRALVEGHAEPTAAEVGRRFGRSEAWGRDIKKRAAAESPNGKTVLMPQ